MADTAIRIAIVDDSPELVDVLREVLTDEGYQVVAFSGEEEDLLDAMVAARPDLIILDLLLPGPSAQLSGWDLLVLFRHHAALRRVPVLVCSGDVVALRQREAELARDPRLAAVEKPFTLTQLEEAVEHLIGADRVPEWDDERDLVLVADRDARLVHASAAMLAVLGMSPQELQAKRVADIVAQEEDWIEREWERYLAEGHWTGPITLQSSSRGRIPATANATILHAGAAAWHVSRIAIQGS